MRPIKTFLTALPLCLLAACATTAPPADMRGPQDVAFEGQAADSTYGLFLAGQAALNRGQNEEASQFFSQASVGSLDASFLKERAFTAALLAGDIQKAANLAPVGEEGGTATQRLGLLVRAVEALASGKGKDANAILQADGIGFPHRPAAALLAPWAAAQAGDAATAILRPEVRGDKVVEYFGQLGQAQLLERSRLYADAEAAYKSLSETPDVGGLFVLDYGAFLERRGRQVEAIALYDGLLASEPDDRQLTQARRRAAATGPAPALSTIKEGAARALVAPAAVMLAEKQAELSLAYLRLALRLDPTRDEAWSLLGDIMAAMGQTDEARVAYGRISATSANYAGVRAKMAWTYQSQGDHDTALKLAWEALQAAPDDHDAAVTYADLLRANDRYAESAKVLDGVIAAAGPKPDWRLLYMRGVALERSGRWPEAEADLKRAIAQEPDEPELLNYLGYSWIDRGERLTEAMDMVKRAVTANPRSGAMVDSLGWAYYRLGKYGDAVEQLETAVELEPADPEINNHLGDAYWQVGRRIEAQFQWRRSLSLEPTDKVREELEAKLKNGLVPLGKPGQAAVVAGR